MEVNFVKFISKENGMKVRDAIVIGENVFSYAFMHTHTHQNERHESKHSRMQETNSKVKNFASQECKQKKKSSDTTPVKLESKK